MWGWGWGGQSVAGGRKPWFALATAAQFLHEEAPSLFWAHGTLEPCTFSRGAREARGESSGSASILPQLDKTGEF